MITVIFIFTLFVNSFNVVLTAANCYYPSNTIDVTCTNTEIDTVSYSKCTQGTLVLYCLINANDNNYACCSDNTDITMIGLEILEALASFTPPLPTTTTVTQQITTTSVTNNNDGCVDLSKNCNLYKNFCNKYRYQVICPKTCNSCRVTIQPSTSISKKNMCKDLSDNCSEMAMYCQDATYIDVMSSVCPVTCQKCGPPDTWNNNTIVVQNPKTYKCKNDNTQCNFKTIYCKMFSC
uniref:ShKT domain-containing protein n=1 Tax=Strongyloides papillosus TaxID=174720 RepID=A0A0N5BLL1_STREA